MWGDYGRSDRKVFMGVAQIKLDDLDLSSMAIGWYKLFSNSSLVGSHGTTPGGARSGSAGNILEGATGQFGAGGGART